MNDIIKVVIIEDDKELAFFLQELISNTEGFECEHIFYTGEDAIRGIPKLSPDVILTDVGLPEMSGVECIAFLKPLHPTINFLICTSYSDSETVFEALKAGATGYVTKGDDPNNILDAIRQIHAGGSPMSHHIARLVVNHFQVRKNLPETEHLSQRELDVLQPLSEGYRYKEIADQLHISPETVRTHVRNIYQKLSVTSRMEAINKVYGKRQDLKNRN